MSPTLDNYVNVLSKGGFGSAVFNTTHIALVCLIGFCDSASNDGVRSFEKNGFQQVL